jgi:hypothetical protein
LAKARALYTKNPGFLQPLGTVFLWIHLQLIIKSPSF